MATKLTNSDGSEICSVMNKQEIFDMIHPAGEVYVQYPGQKDPNYLYTHNQDGSLNGIECTWEYFTGYAGAFFRTEGGEAEDFNPNTINGARQHYQLPNIKGNLGCVYGYDRVEDPFYNSHPNVMATFTNGGSLCMKWVGMDLSKIDSTVYVNNGEVRPVNYTIRIWIRMN